MCTWLRCLICGQVGGADGRFGAAMGAEHHQGFHPHRGVRHGRHAHQDQVRCVRCLCCPYFEILFPTLGWFGCHHLIYHLVIPTFLGAVLEQIARGAIHHVQLLSFCLVSQRAGLGCQASVGLSVISEKVFTFTLPVENNASNMLCIVDANPRSLNNTHLEPYGMALAPGKKFGDAADDWQFWHGKIPAVLRKWYERGYKVAIISNQMGIGTGKADKQTVRCGAVRCGTARYCTLIYCKLVAASFACFLSC